MEIWYSVILKVIDILLGIQYDLISGKQIDSFNEQVSQFPREHDRTNSNNKKNGAVEADD